MTVVDAVRLRGGATLRGVTKTYGSGEAEVHARDIARWICSGQAGDPLLAAFSADRFDV